MGLHIVVVLGCQERLVLQAHSGQYNPFLDRLIKHLHKLNAFLPAFYDLVKAATLIIVVTKTRMRSFSVGVTMQC